MVNIDKVLNVRDDSEMSMAKSDLYNLAKNSVELYKLIQGLNELEGWTQAKITKAADYIGSVLNYMKYEAHEDRIGLNEMASSGGTSAGAIAGSPMSMGKKKVIKREGIADSKNKLDHLGKGVDKITTSGGSIWYVVRIGTMSKKFRSEEKARSYRKEFLEKEKNKKITNEEEKQKGIDGKACWDGYKRMGTKMKSGKRVDNCVPIKKKK